MHYITERSGNLLDNRTMCLPISVTTSTDSTTPAYFYSPYRCKTINVNDYVLTLTHHTQLSVSLSRTPPSVEDETESFFSSNLAVS